MRSVTITAHSLISSTLHCVFSPFTLHLIGHSQMCKQGLDGCLSLTDAQRCPGAQLFVKHLGDRSIYSNNMTLSKI